MEDEDDEAAAHRTVFSFIPEQQLDKTRLDRLGRGAYIQRSTRTHENCESESEGAVEMQ